MLKSKRLTMMLQVMYFMTVMKFFLDKKGKTDVKEYKFLPDESELFVGDSSKKVYIGGKSSGTL